MHISFPLPVLHIAMLAMFSTVSVLILNAYLQLTSPSYVYVSMLCMMVVYILLNTMVVYTMYLCVAGSFCLRATPSLDVCRCTTSLQYGYWKKYTDWWLLTDDCWWYRTCSVDAVFVVAHLCLGQYWMCSSCMSKGCHVNYALMVHCTHVPMCTYYISIPTCMLHVPKIARWLSGTEHLLTGTWRIVSQEQCTAWHSRHTAIEVHIRVELAAEVDRS